MNYTSFIQTKMPTNLIWIWLFALLVAQLVKNLPVCGRLGFDPWVRKIPWRREWLFTPVFWPGELHGLYCPRCRKESDMTEPLSLSLSFMLHPLNSTLTCGPFYLICCFHMRIWCLLKSSGPDLLLSSNNPLSYHSIYILPKNLWRFLNL